MALLDVKTAEDFYALLQRLAGSTYGSNLESSIFQRQLRSWAVLLATGRDEIDRGFRQAFPDLSDALIAEWEQAYNLPNDSARSLAERQARLAGHMRTQKGAARAELQASLDVTGVLASFVANRRDEVLMADSEAAAIFQSTLQLANEDFYDPILRDAVETIYGNVLPAKHVGALDAPGPGHSTCVEVDATWNAADRYVGRDAIARQVSTVRNEFMGAAQARVRSYGPGSRIDARDLNRIQETTAGSPLTGELQLIDFGTIDAGLTQYWFGCELSDGVPLEIDTSIDWRDRMLLALFAWSRDGTGSKKEIIPSGAEDDEWGNNLTGGGGNGDVNQSTNNAMIYVYTGSGSTGVAVHRGYNRDPALSVALYSAVDGDLFMESTGDDYFVSGVIFVTPDLDKQ